MREIFRKDSVQANPIIPNSRNLPSVSGDTLLDTQQALRLRKEIQIGKRA